MAIYHKIVFFAFIGLILEATNGQIEQEQYLSIWGDSPICQGNPTLIHKDPTNNSPLPSGTVGVIHVRPNGLY